MAEIPPTNLKQTFEPLHTVDAQECQARVELADEYIILGGALWDELNYMLFHTEKFNLERFSQIRSTAIEFENLSRIYLGKEKDYSVVDLKKYENVFEEYKEYTNFLNSKDTLELTSK